MVTRVAHNNSTAVMTRRRQNIKYINMSLMFMFTDRVHAPQLFGIINQVIYEYFEPILGQGNVDPSELFIAATVDQGGNMVNAMALLGIIVIICSGHRLNSVVGWGLGINGSYKDGHGTCKNPALRALMAKMTACAGVFSHSPCYNDALKDIQREFNELSRMLEIVRRNDTRYSPVIIACHAVPSSFVSNGLVFGTYLSQQLISANTEVALQ